MPDFKQPRMKKPELLLIESETGRPIQISIMSIYYIMKNNQQKTNFNV